MLRLLYLIAFFIFAAFVGILAYSVPSPDLIAVVVFTLALVGWDCYRTTRGPRN